MGTISQRISEKYGLGKKYNVNNLANNNVFNILTSFDDGNLY